MDTCLWLAESLRCSPETNTTLLIGYTPTQNKKNFPYIDNKNFPVICKLHPDLQRKLPPNLCQGLENSSPNFPHPPQEKKDLAI